MPTVSFNQNQIKRIKQEITHGRPYAERISFALAVRMISTKVDVYPILDEIDFLENLRNISSTKNATQFNHPPLFPLWHKHFATGSHIINNIFLRWNLFSGGKGNKDLKKMIKDVANDYGNDPDKWPKVLAHTLAIGGFEDRYKRGLTGDWIIYGEHNGQKYYLDLASHEEGKNPEKLYNKLRNGCAPEFPFFFNFDAINND